MNGHETRFHARFLQKTKAINTLYSLMLTITPLKKYKKQ